MERGQYLGEISALCFLHLPPPSSSLPYLLAGTGSQLLFYDLVTGTIKASFQVFQGIRVHGICCLPVSSTETSLTSKVAVFGERRLKLFLFNINFPFHNDNTSSQHHQQKETLVDLLSFQTLPRFSHWVLDACFIKECVIEGNHCLAIGCTDNTVYFWDSLKSKISYHVSSPDRSLLYTMRMWGDNIDVLHIASGTIYNEILVWKVVVWCATPCLNSGLKDDESVGSSFGSELLLSDHQYEAVPVCRLAGHEGSIFRITWSSDGSKLVSVSDDRSARIWEVHAGKRALDYAVELVVYPETGPVLFGHNARVWDCCISDSLIITVGEDCTCRVWGLDGVQLKTIKEHIGRGIWRCLYDPISNLIVTAGFDSAIKVHRLESSLSTGLKRCNEVVEEHNEGKNIFTIQIPSSSKHIALMDSKSEYVRCMHFAREDVIYVATNNGFLYHAKICDNGDVQWTELFHVSDGVPVVCMNVFPGRSSEFSTSFEDWIALGDGKGRLTVLEVVANACAPSVELCFTWSAEAERQLLGTFWCKSLGHRFIFTSDPRGRLKLWNLCNPLNSASENATGVANASLVAEFVSCFPIRIICLDASFQDEVLVCGDLRGNLVLFSLLRDLMFGTPVATIANISPITYFKGGHGISSVCSVSVVSSNCDEVEIHSTGGDGCICYLEYDKSEQKLEFIGMKLVKELSLVQSLFPKVTPHTDLSTGNYAIGFASADFIIWNLSTDAKIAEIPCGGWRRPHSYYLGEVPEMKNCFAFVKDEIIYIYKHWVPGSGRKIYPQNLHLQFHGREMHSLCFILEDTLFSSDEKQPLTYQSGLIATGCEDGTVRLTRYSPGISNWFASKLLGEHVGGSAVRSLCSVWKAQVIVADTTPISCTMYRQVTTLDDRENAFLLISVGAKRVLTAWKRKISSSKKEEACVNAPANGYNDDIYIQSEVSQSTSFQWLSSDMPTRNSHTRSKGLNKEKTAGDCNSHLNLNSDRASHSLPSEKRTMESKLCCSDDHENDWRYLAVTAFLVKFAGSRISVCFIVVSCSDATVTLKALVLPYRLWFDIALLVSLASPVLSLQHVIVPEHLSFKDKTQVRSLYVIISGSTDGSIAFWDLTETVENFMRKVSAFRKEDYRDSQSRPRTGRGSQGGRMWRSLDTSKKTPADNLVTTKPTENMEHDMQDQTSSDLGCAERSTAVSMEVHANGSSQEISTVWPFHVLNNVHQSGVNCLHVSGAKDGEGCESVFSYFIISGGDDQALQCLCFDVMLPPLSCYHESGTSKTGCIPEAKAKSYSHYYELENYQIGFSYPNKIVSAHSSAIKGVWTDGNWVFSAGLDQRVRCWGLSGHGKLTEHAHLIISVPEPEALDARVCSRNHYQIAVAGRGMQMVEFFPPGGTDDEEVVM